MCSPKPLKAGVWHQKYHSELIFWGYRNPCYLHQALLKYIGCCLQLTHKIASKDPPEVVTIPDEDEGKEEEDDWPETRPVNIGEAKSTWTA